jgi:hypothetical protein
VTADEGYLPDTPDVPGRSAPTDLVLKADKPLKSKAYGSIGHLPNSRIGSGDWHVTEGMARILCERPRPGDRIVAREKADGACMGIANVGGALHALGRAGYPASSAPHEHLRLFDDYVARRRDLFSSLLRPDERIVGEWLNMAHGTMYDAGHPGFAPFVAFDIFRSGKRVLTDEFEARCVESGIVVATKIHDGETALSVEEALARLGPHGFHGATETIEGAVWRVEAKGKVEFLAKYVRPDKIDGKYLPGVEGNVTGDEPVWLWREA